LMIGKSLGGLYMRVLVLRSSIGICCGAKSHGSLIHRSWGYRVFGWGLREKRRNYVS